MYSFPDLESVYCSMSGSTVWIKYSEIGWIMEKARELQRNIYFRFTDYTEVFDCVNHNKLWEILKEMGISDHLTCPLRNHIQVRKQQSELDIEQQTGSK